MAIISDVVYSICITNYNMGKTIERSLSSILSQIGEEFEVVVVDAGSDDGSLDYLREKDRNQEITLIVEEGCSRGQGRNIAAKASEGEVLLHQLDMDDEYYDGSIPAFVEVFEELRDKLDFDFYLSGHHINAVTRDLFLEVDGYRDMVVEDNDLWRRLMDKGALISLDHKPVCHEIGSGKSTYDFLERNLQSKYSEIRSGVSPLSIIRWHLAASKNIDGNSWKMIPWNIVSVLWSYFLISVRGVERYSTPEPYDDFVRYMSENSYKSLEEIESKYNISIDKRSFSGKTKELFLGV